MDRMETFQIGFEYVGDLNKLLLCSHGWFKLETFFDGMLTQDIESHERIQAALDCRFNPEVDE